MRNMATDSRSRIHLALHIAVAAILCGNSFATKHARTSTAKVRFSAADITRHGV